MPRVARAKKNEVVAKRLDQRLYDDRYAEGLDWHPNSDLHKFHVARILELANSSFGTMSARHDSWKKIDHNLTGFVTLDEEEEKEKSHDERKPMSVVVPMTFAAKETLLTYMTGVFLDRDVYFPYEGVGPEDVIGSLMMQHVIQQQMMRTSGELQLHTQWGDSFSYGIGIVAPQWETEFGEVAVPKRTGFWDGLTGLFNQTGRESIMENRLIREGNALHNIDPYRFLPDVSKSPDQLQRGEFVGWLASDNLPNMLSEEEVDSTSFNAKYLSGRENLSALNMKDGGRDDHALWDSLSPREGVRPVDHIWMYRKVIPLEEKLGDSDVPEKWLFRLSADSIITKAQQLNLNHNQFPVVVCAADYNGYSAAPLSRLEVIWGLQEVVDWLFSSHIANVRKSVNNTFVVDPYRIDMRDILDRQGKAGGIYRTRRASWGKGVQDAIMQLKVDDVTRQNLPDTQIIMSFMERVTGASESLQGIFGNAPERRTATEFEQTRGSASARLAKMARIIQAMSMRPLAHMLAAHTQQLMKEETYIKISGDLEKRLVAEYGLEAEVRNGRVAVSPQDLDVNYDIFPSDGRSTADVDSTVLIRLLELGLQSPVFGQSFDMVRLFKSIARRAGEKNIDEFEKKGQNANIIPMPDAQVQEQVQRGNLVAV